jgi:hypothetical protein
MPPDGVRNHKKPYDGIRNREMPRNGNYSKCGNGIIELISLERRDSETRSA